MVKTLEQCNKEALLYFDIHNGQPTEFDKSINDTSRDTIEAMYHEKGECWLGNINLYDRHEIPFTLTEYTLDTKIYNFSYDFILPKHSPEIEKMINDRFNKTQKNLYKNGADIIDAILKLGGVLLTWT